MALNLYGEARKKIKSIKSNGNILTYAKLQVKTLPGCVTLKKQLKCIETETLIKSNTIKLKPEPETS